MKLFKKKYFIIIFSIIIILLSLSFDTNDDSNGYWTTGMDVIRPGRRGGAGAFWPNQSTPSFFFIGGDTNTLFPTPYVDKFNLLTNQWTRMADMLHPVRYHSACILGDSLYIVGGLFWTGYNSACDFVQKYDINADSWSDRAHLPFSTGWNQIVAYQDSLIYSLGGFINFTSNGSANVYLYNALSNNWRIATSLPDPNCGMAAVITGDTIVIFNGGQTVSTYTWATYRGLISQTDRSQITWTYGAGYPSGPVRINAASWGCKGIITTPGTGTSNSSCFTYCNDTWEQQPNIPHSVMLPACGSYINGGVGKFICASGALSAPPWMSLFTQIYTDSLCPPIGIKKIDEQLPVAYILYQNYPNPFNPSTTIKYSLPHTSFVSILVFDVQGREVEKLINENINAGTYEINFDGSKLSSGVYFYKLTTKDFQDAKKMLIIK